LLDSPQSARLASFSPTVINLNQPPFFVCARAERSLVSQAPQAQEAGLLQVRVLFGVV
jgi:hypothetical protein